MRAVLTSNAGVTAVVGGRIYPWQRQEDSVFPAIVYRSVAEGPKQSLRSEVGLSETTIEYECVTTKVADSIALAELVRQALAGVTTLATISPVAIRHTGSRSLFIDPFDGSAEGLYSVVVEFTVLHRTPALA
jgi:hypothetical protein